MERIEIGTFGPFNKSQNGYRFIVIATDYLTKYLFTKTIPLKSACEIADSICNDIIFQHGCPYTILSDNEKETIHKIIDTIFQKLFINKKYLTPYRPQTNGLTKKTNRTFLSILEKFYI